MTKKISKEDVRHIARLARLGVSDDEVERFSNQLSDILEAFEVLQHIDTSDVEPTSHSVAVSNVLRDDIVTPSLPASEVLRNAPNEEDGCFRVRAVLE